MNYKNYLRQYDTLTDRELALLTIAVVLLGSSLVLSGYVQVVFVVVGLLLLMALQVAVAFAQIGYVARYRQVFNQKGGVDMSKIRLESKLRSLSSEVGELQNKIQTTHNLVKQLTRQAYQVKSDLLSGAYKKASNTKSLYKNERQLAVIRSKIRFLTLQENTLKRTLEQEKEDLYLADSLYNKAKLGDTSALRRAEKTLAHY